MCFLSFAVFFVFCNDSDYSVEFVLDFTLAGAELLSAVYSVFGRHLQFATSPLCQAAWDETDEWNALTMKVIQHLKSRAQIHCSCADTVQMCRCFQKCFQKFRRLCYHTGCAQNTAEALGQRGIRGNLAFRDDLHALDRIAVLEQQAAGSVLQKAMGIWSELREMKPC